LGKNGFMKIGIIGAGYVGLVTAACLAEFGFQVTCCDKQQARIDMLNQGKSPIFEPGLELLLNKHADKNLFFTSDIQKLIQHNDVLFIAVGTPSDPDTGAADLSAVFHVAAQISDHLNQDKVVVTKSTVPVGTTRRLKQHFTDALQGKNSPHNIHVVSNPEFLREGSAIEDFMRPDRVIIGTDSDYSKSIMDMIYRPLYLYETPIVWTDFESAELTKYASNAFLATKVAFINEIANLCEKTNGTIDDVAKGLGLDKRIGHKFLHPSPGYGGSCFPKDTLAIAHLATEKNAPLTIVDSVITSNDNRKKNLITRIQGFLGKTPYFDHSATALHGKKAALLGLSFKPNTDDMRESPALYVVPDLLAAGCIVSAFDPEAHETAQQVIEDHPKLSFENSITDCLKDADFLVILTEWNQFRALDLGEIKTMMNNPVICDYRNIFAPNMAKQHGFCMDYVGKPALFSTETAHIEMINKKNIDNGAKPVSAVDG
jgi:UDPglucose 6-dehydrogenase